jgi:DNA-binding NarL/FixJ family response regulator
MTAQIRLAICHQVQLLRECLSFALMTTEDIEVAVMNEPNTDGGLRSLTERVDVLLIDASLPHMMAFRLIQTLRAMEQAPRTILLISASSPDLIESCLQAGADACVLDGDTLDDLRQAIKNVLAGRSYCSPQVAHRLFTQMGGRTQPAGGQVRAAAYSLTRREIEILRMIADRNLSNKQIARELRLSIYTVKNHVHSIIEKLRAKDRQIEDRQMAARHAARQGLLSEPIA